MDQEKILVHFFVFVASEIALAGRLTWKNLFYFPLEIKQLLISFEQLKSASILKEY